LRFLRVLQAIQVKHMHQQLLKLLPKFALATVFCVSLGAVGAIAQVNPAQAKDKSAVSPDIVIPSAEESTPTRSESVPEPAPAPANVDIVTAPSAPAPVEVQAPQTPQEVKPARRVEAKVEAEPVLVEVQSRKEPRRNVAVSTPKNARERVDIIMESRTSGCRSQVNDTSGLQPNLCAPTVQPRDYRGYQTVASRPSYVYESPSGFRAEVRRLSPREIKAMSRPSNGDKRMQFPLAIPAFISSSFGYRTHPITGQGRFHQGTDIAAAEGTPVLAAYSGNVEVAGWFGGLGLAVVISHGDRHETRYGHMSEVLVKPGQYVKQGTVIGLVGSTGFSTGPHLHFELWEKMRGDWVAIDSTDQLTLALEELNRFLAQLSKPSVKA
jgi:murein DD-endopeptidase MepM/ murein hydrolase activator NlpD